MPSSLTWIDYDSVAREKAIQIIGMFKEQGSRDELGLGAIRDSFSDKLFPGTSTVQTRLRYMLIIPWVYQALEEKSTSSDEIEKQARRFELDLIRPLTESDDSEGVIGAEAGRNLKRLPSDVYWTGLGEWGIRRFIGSIRDYHRSLDHIYEIRRNRKTHDENSMRDSDASTWHPCLPDPPMYFRDELSLSLTREEAEFIRDAIVRTAGSSLLGWLVREGKLADVDKPWEHPDWAQFPESIKELLRHARLFSKVMHGAAFLYNLMLAEEAGEEEWADAHRGSISGWADTLDAAAVAEWELPDMWEIIAHSRHTIRPGARRFVRDWVQVLREGPHGVIDNKKAQDLVRKRERTLKKGRSRFGNPQALARWNNNSGTGRMTFRWSTAKTFLEDMAEAFKRADSC